MILPDWKIRLLCDRGMVAPYAPENVNPASIDLRIDGEYYDIVNNRQVEGVIRLWPGVAVLATTIEYIKLPVNVAGQLVLKSSMGRRGVSMPAAGWVDPGFEGTLTVQLVSYAPVRLEPGDRFIQLVLHNMASIPNVPYQGHYQGQRGVTRAYNSDVDDGPASLNEHIIYLAPTEGLQLEDWKAGSGL